MKKNALPLFLGTIMLFFAGARSSSNDWVIYGPANSGYPSDAVVSFGIDHSDVKWLGTFSSGIVKFTGTRWNTYDTSDTKLTTNWVQTIGTSPTGLVWFSSWSLGPNGLVSLNGNTWTSFVKSSAGWSGLQIRAITCESNGTAWFCTTDSGVQKFDGTTWTSYKASNSLLPGNEVVAAAIAPDGAKWFGTSKGLAKFDGSTWTTFGAPAGFTAKSIVDRSIAIQKNGNVWVGTADSGVYSYDGSAWKKYDNTTTPALGLYGNHVPAVAVDSSQNIWISTGLGIARFDGSSWKKFSSFYETSSDSFFPGTSTTAIAVESSGRKWFLSTSEGLIADKVINAAKRPVSNAFGKGAISKGTVVFSNACSFDVGATAGGRLTVLDAAGRIVRILSIDNVAEGVAQVHWDGKDRFGSPVGVGRYSVSWVGHRAPAAFPVTLLKIR
jgi:ligand-binding sensor domain-containing protein